MPKKKTGIQNQEHKVQLKKDRENTANSDTYLKLAIEIARENVNKLRGGPFGAVIVKDGKIIAKAVNCVTATHDPSAHAEIVAIRQACRKLKNFQLAGCTLYSSCEPCPMCLGAIYWARPDRLIFSSSRKEAARAGFDDDLIYQELKRPYPKRKLKTTRRKLAESESLWKAWKASTQKVEY